MGITIKDVAKEAKVSPSTISRVLSGNPKISDETKEKVMKVVKKLNYHPNAIARSLANNSTSTIGLILPNEAEDLFKNPFFIQIMTGISVYAQKAGYYLIYSFGKNEKEELNIIRNYTNSKMVDGVILLTSRTDDKCIEYLKKKNYPFVVVGRPDETEGVLWVDNDNFDAMYKVVNKIILKGHKDIAFIGGTEDWNVSKDRLEGYKKAISIHGIKLDDRLIIHKADFCEYSGYSAMMEILQYKKPSAVVATDDLLAFGVIKALKERDLENISVIGFNNTPLSEYQSPPLTSVEINSDKLGYYAAKLLLDKLTKENSNINYYIVDTNLIERESLK